MTPALATYAPPIPTRSGATEYVYKRVTGAELKLYVFQPPGSAPSERRPAVVCFPGGGWINLHLDDGLRAASRLASLGVVGIAATYRVRSIHDSTPYDSVADAKSLLRWLRERAGDLRIDPARVAGVGDSAGAHVLLTAALLDTFDEPAEDRTVTSKPDALFLTAAVVTTIATGSCHITPEQQMFVDFLGSRAQEVSPLHHLARNLPPTLLYHGKQDPLMPYDAVETFCAMARALGNQCELVGFDGVAHDVARAKQAETFTGLFNFLEARGYLP